MNAYSKTLYKVKKKKKIAVKVNSGDIRPSSLGQVKTKVD